MDTLKQGEHFDGKDSAAQKNEVAHVSCGIVSSTQDECSGDNKRPYPEDGHKFDIDDDDFAKKKRTEAKELGEKPAPVSRKSTGRLLIGSKTPGPASNTGVAPLNRQGRQSQGKGSSGKGEKGAHRGKSSSGSKSSNSGSKQDRKCPVANPKPNHGKDIGEGDNKDQKTLDFNAPKVPPLKIFIPGGGSTSQNEQEGEGTSSSGQSGSGKGRSNAATLPYVIPCTADAGQPFDSFNGNSDVKRVGDGGKLVQRVLRSHKTNDDKGKDRTLPGLNALNSNKSPPPCGQDGDQFSSSKNDSSKSELHPRKRKIKASKDSHRQIKNKPLYESSNTVHNIVYRNPYQMHIYIRNQIDRRKKRMFPIKPKPPKDFNNYLTNRCTYTLQSNANPEPQVEIPHNMPSQMVTEFLMQEKERTRMRIQHRVEKEKLVLAVEQDILRVHERAERVANQSLPFSVCTILRYREVYSKLPPHQAEKRNAQRSRCNGRKFNSWLQELDDKWEKIKEDTLRRQHTEAQTLYAVQSMEWEWKLKELGICDYKTTPKLDSTHVPLIHVPDYDL